MNIEDIIKCHEQLNNQLKNALITMERKDDIKEIRSAIIENQKKCPHYSNKYNWAIIDEKCPYCGMKLG